MSEEMPFKDFKLAEDICKCNNEKCLKRHECFRYMGKNTERQSMTTYDDKDCEHYYPFYVWEDGFGQKYLLKDITDDHLENIIEHLKNRLTEVRTRYVKDDRCIHYGKALERLLNEFKIEYNYRGILWKRLAQNSTQSTAEEMED